MDQATLFQQIFNDPDDVAPRYAFAEWLTQGGQANRAEWIVASCKLSHLAYNDPSRTSALELERQTFARCRPAWWDDITSVDQINDRGLFKFVVGDSRSSRGLTPIKRLAKTSWIGTAHNEGWLHSIQVMWADTELAEQLAKWKAPVALVPLFVRPAPQIENDGLQRLLGLTQLYGLDLESNVLRNPVLKELASFPNIRELVMEFRLVDDGTVDEIVAQLARMTGLRKLHLKGHEKIEYGSRPNDNDLIQIGKNTDLNRIFLSSAPAVSDVSIETIKRSCPLLIVHRR